MGRSRKLKATESLIFKDLRSRSRTRGATMVDVAQLVEPRVVIPVVVGSSPIVHPTFALDTVGR